MHKDTPAGTRVKVIDTQDPRWDAYATTLSTPRSEPISVTITVIVVGIEFDTGNADTFELWQLQDQQHATTYADRNDGPETVPSPKFEIGQAVESDDADSLLVRARQYRSSVAAEFTGWFYTVAPFTEPYNSGNAREDALSLPGESA